MLVASYNNKGLNDVLVVMVQKSTVDEQEAISKGSITRLVKKDTGETVGYNFFEASKLVDIKTNGPVTLTTNQVDKLNQALNEVGFDDHLTADESPKFVVGYVKECTPHEDSDHLNVTKTEVDNGEVLQIVCGASNIAQGQKVVVAKEGAIMPDGLVIWAGELRGVKSKGMICSAKELGLDNPSQQKGILVLEESEEIGKAFAL
jgi:tRNA-binding protein